MVMQLMVIFVGVVVGNLLYHSGIPRWSLAIILAIAGGVIFTCSSL